MLFSVRAVCFLPLPYLTKDANLTLTQNPSTTKISFKSWLFERSLPLYFPDSQSTGLYCPSHLALVFETLKTGFVTFAELCLNS